MPPSRTPPGTCADRGLPRDAGEASPRIRRPGSDVARAWHRPLDGKRARLRQAHGRAPPEGARHRSAQVQHRAGDLGTSRHLSRPRAASLAPDPLPTVIPRVLRRRPPAPAPSSFHRGPDRLGVRAASLCRMWGGVCRAPVCVCRPGIPFPGGRPDVGDDQFGGPRRRRVAQPTDVSSDTPLSGARFPTCKYMPDGPTCGFAPIEPARA